MNETTSIWIHCYGCDAVRKVDGSPCPSCGRCAFCGQKITTDFDCGCYAEIEPSEVVSFFKKAIIPADQVERETRRMQIRKGLDSRKLLVVTLVVTVLPVTLGRYLHEVAGFCLGVLVTAAIVLLFFVLVDWIFKRVEDRRLAKWEREK